MSDTVLCTTNDRVAILTLNRPDALNALNAELIDSLVAHVIRLDADNEVGCIIITGSEKAFAAGADIKEMKDKSFADMVNEQLFANCDAIIHCQTPIIAAVSGFALGGGCEVAMMCDMIFAADTAKFGQPEIKLGVVPGIGGTQRLTKAIGKARAMDMVLTGRMIDAQEALASGLIARVIDSENLMQETLNAARTIAGYSMPVVTAAKSAVNQAQNVSLSDGLTYERALFYSMFALEDQTEGMNAFVEKRKPQFTHR